VPTSIHHRRRGLKGRGRQPVLRSRFYMRLMRAANIVMSNTPSEMRDLLEFRRRVGGEVLISGLGLGIIAQIASAKAAVSTVTVIEIFRRRQRLVAPLSPTNA
jgi:hypothetical protein